mgnify:FL=1
MKIKIREKDIQRTILHYLAMKGILAHKHRSVGIFKKATGSYIPLPLQDRGISDIIGCLHGGRFFAIEVKAPGNKMTKEQANYLAKVAKAGGLAILAYSLDDVIKGGI